MAEFPTTAQRQAVTARAGGVCEYCRSLARYSVQSFECEHIFPLSQGGTTILDNLAYACGGCNRSKAARTEAPDPEDGSPTSLFHPRTQDWDDHFAWSDDFTLIIGLTAVGRSTVAALHLNRPGVVNLRRVLVAVGQHPPVVRDHE